MDVPDINFEKKGRGRPKKRQRAGPGRPSNRSSIPIDSNG